MRSKWLFVVVMGVYGTLLISQESDIERTVKDCHQVLVPNPNEEKGIRYLKDYSIKMNAEGFVQEESTYTENDFLCQEKTTYKPDQKLECALRLMGQSDLTSAEIILQKLVDLEYEPAYFHLGFLYHKKNEIEKAVKYYQLAAEKNNANAYLQLGGIYIAEYKFLEARDNWQLAANLGSVEAQERLSALTLFAVLVASAAGDTIMLVYLLMKELNEFWRLTDLAGILIFVTTVCALKGMRTLAPNMTDS